MPITITPPPPGLSVGPFVALKVSSDFIGPLPTGSFWHVFLGYGVELNPLQTILEVRAPTATPQSSVFLGKSSANSSVVSFNDRAFKDGDQVLVTVLLESPTTVTDSGAITLPWQADIGQLQLPDQIQETTGGGLTEEQALELSETHASTFPDQLVDNLTLIALTTGPSPGPINANLLDTTFGVIVRIATVPPDLLPQTPDGDYWVKTLAVVRIYRGSDMWKRYPIHTSSHLISFLDDSVVASVTAVTATQWLLNMTLQTTFLEGVTGEVFLMRFP